MKPAVTIQFHTCYICDLLYGPKAGRYVWLRLVGIITTQVAEKVWLCDECIEEIRAAAVPQGTEQKGD